jgi:hypothetical protein
MTRLRKAPHYCYEWDEMYIRPWDPEADCCLCRFTWKAWVQCWWRYVSGAKR